MWTNFAIYGNPTPTEASVGIIWEPVKSSEEINTLIIGEELEIEVNPNEDSTEFWKSIFAYSTLTQQFL